MSPQRSRLKETLRIVLPLAILGAGVAGYLIIGNRQPVPKRPSSGQKAPLVETVAVDAAPDGLSFDVDGLVVPFREIEVAGEVAGRVTYKSPDCRAGKYVTKGQRLLEIDRRTYELEVERFKQEVAQAGVTIDELDVEAESAQALIELAEEQLELQKKQLARIETVYKRGAASDSQLEAQQQNTLAARNNVLTLRNQLRTLQTRRSRLEQGMRLAEARLEQAKLDLQRTEVTAPIDGMIISDMVEEDSYVQTGTPLLTVEDTSAVEVRCNLRMDELVWVWRQRKSKAASEQRREPAVSSAIGGAPRDYQLPPTPVTVGYRLDGTEFQWSGTLSRYEGIGLDEQTRTVPCRVVVPHPREPQIAATDSRLSASTLPQPPALVRGMYVNLTVHTDPAVTLLRVPEAAIRPGNVVWRVRDGSLDIEPVRVAHVTDGVVLLLGDAGDLRAEDRLIVSPLAAVEDGMPVREQAEEAEPEPNLTTAARDERSMR